MELDGRQRALVLSLCELPRVLCAKVTSRHTRGVDRAEAAWQGAALPARLGLSRQERSQLGGRKQTAATRAATLSRRPPAALRSGRTAPAERFGPEGHRRRRSLNEPVRHDGGGAHAAEAPQYPSVDDVPRQLRHRRRILRTRRRLALQHEDEAACVSPLRCSTLGGSATTWPRQLDRALHRWQGGLVPRAPLERPQSNRGPSEARRARPWRLRMPANRGATRRPRARSARRRHHA